MHLYETKTNKKQILEMQNDYEMWKPEFPDTMIDMADRLEIWCSSFNDAGEDFCEYRLMLGDNILDQRKVAGF